MLFYSTWTPTLCGRWVLHKGVVVVVGVVVVAVVAVVVVLVVVVVDIADYSENLYPA